jgi:hypothetical protein
MQKIIILFAIIALSQAVPPSQGWQRPTEAPANYEFNYEVHDEQTGDIKRQSEHAQNGNIQGQYSLYDADGFRRIVEYTANDEQGFIANVRREKIEGQRQPARKQGWAQPQTVTKYVQAAPSHGWQ